MAVFYWRRGAPYARAAVGPTRYFGRLYRGRYIAPAAAYGESFSAVSVGGSSLGGSSSVAAALAAGAGGGAGWGASASASYVFYPSGSGGLSFGGLGLLVASGPAKIREAVVSRLAATSGVASLVGTRIHHFKLPQAAILPAVSYSVASRSYGRTLLGPNGMSAARVRISAWSTTESQADALAQEIRGALDGFRGPVGQVVITETVLESETDLPTAPQAGGDQAIYQIVLDFYLAHRVSIPAPN